MFKKISIPLFWLLFFGFFLIFTLPNLFSYAKNGLPGYMGDTLLQNQLRFIVHVYFGTIVYITGFIQFTPYFRNRNLWLHRKLGKLYIFSSLVCIGTLALIIPEGLCTACRPSQYIVTCLWLLFILLAYGFIRRRQVEWHRRFMISSFICAAYFVTVRVVDKFAMGLFRAVTKDEAVAMLISDISVWLVPLVIFWTPWLHADFVNKPRMAP